MNYKTIYRDYSCLQKKVDDLLEIISHICKDSNPAYLNEMRLKYEKNEQDGKYK
tara:strand:- start:805 stop:966 length:162 start_codon:yes stop_codon:yes gene_type:complete